LRDRRRILEWESKWDLPAGLVTFAAVVILIVSAIVIASVNGSGNAELLEAAYEHKSSVTLSSILEAIGFVMLIAPLYFLFRATAARNSRVRTQLVGVIIAAPLFFGISGVLNGVATNEGAEAFEKGESHPTLSASKATEECKSEAKDKGAKEFAEEYEGAGTPLALCEKEELADSRASHVLSEATYRGVSTGFGLAGRIGLAFALVYTCLFAMRTGLLSRFWGSLGMALGVAALLLLVQFCLIFFIYFGLLLIRKLPGGRPPAWDAGEAIPWETPGQRVAKDLEGEQGVVGADEPIDTTASDGPVEAPEPPEAGESPNGNGGDRGGPQKRKRKRRN
jgi:hypothetical protein